MTEQEFLTRVTRTDKQPFSGFQQVQEALQSWSDVLVDGEVAKIVDIQAHPSVGGNYRTTVVFSNGATLDVDLPHGEEYP